MSDSEYVGMHCWATATATDERGAEHVHRCVRTLTGHQGEHFCRCRQSFADGREALPVRPKYVYIAEQGTLDTSGIEASWALPAYEERTGEKEPMTSPLDQLVTITFVADTNTPAQYASSAGKIIALQTSVQVGTSGHIAGIPGVLRQGATGLEFLMTAEGAGPADTSPPWAQQLATTLAAINTKLDQIIGGAAIKTKTGA